MRDRRPENASAFLFPEDPQVDLRRKCAAAFVPQ
jgi:hypothetical protein